MISLADDVVGGLLVGNSPPKQYLGHQQLRHVVEAGRLTATVAPDVAKSDAVLTTDGDAIRHPLRLFELG